MLPKVSTWLAGPMGRDVTEAIERLREAPDVRQIAVMPDVHLSADVCIGVALATSHLIYPQAVGGDIGCGMLAIATDGDASVLNSAKLAGAILADLRVAVPARRRNRRTVIAQPEGELSHPSLEAIRKEAGMLEFATLGSGNHFLELQADEENRLWLMIHSGSRAMGQAIRDHHLANAEPVAGRLRALDVNTETGAAYLRDAGYAREYADASRSAMAVEVGRVLERRAGVRLCWDTRIATDHNHVALESGLWVHRKGAMPSHTGVAGVLPGSMGTHSFHVEGRGHEPALCSSAHGAGRALSRTEARRRISQRDLEKQMENVWYDRGLAAQLRDEAPSVYKDIRAVMRAQKDLVKITRVVKPVLNYKGL
jgi:tRNA-splicing ligase RtcB